MRRLQIDAATARTSVRLLDPDADAGQPGDYTDLDIATVGQFLESLILSDQLVVPDVSEIGKRCILAPLGEGLKVVRFTEKGLATLRAEAKNWLHEVGRIVELAPLVGAAPLYPYSYRTSDDWTVLGAFGVEKNSTALLEEIRTLLPHEFELHDKAPVKHEAIGTRRPLPEEAAYALDEDEWAFSEKVVFETLRESGLEPSLGVSALRGSESLVQFCVNLSWAAYQARIYDVASRALGIPYAPHGARARIAGYSMMSDDWRFKLYKGSAPFLNALARVFDGATAKVADILRTDVIPLEVPVLLPYILSRASNRANILPVAYDLRDSRGVKKIRDRGEELEVAIQSGDVQTALSISNEVSRLSQSLARSIGLEPGPPVNIAFSIPSIAQIEAPTSLPGGISERLRRAMGPEKPHIMLLRNVYQDLAIAGSLGASYETFFDTN